MRFSAVVGFLLVGLMGLPVSARAAGGWAPQVSREGLVMLDPAALLAAHNGYRARHGASPLTWSPVLATAAQVWADQCKLSHDPARSGWGENLAWGTKMAADTVAMWYREVTKYDFAKPGFAPATAHFTQLVWKGTTQLGCGMALGCPGAFGGGYWVCRYAPPGNVRGRFPENVEAGH